VRIDNMYANVIFDTDESLFKLWYNPFIVDKCTTSTPVDERSSVQYRPDQEEMGICYAGSDDGVAWQKPDLGLVEFDGNTRNNLVMRRMHGAGIYHDVFDPDPARRYKAFMQNGSAVSPDGFHWTTSECPDVEAMGDTHNNAFWDERTGRYVGITRLWDSGQRIVGRTESVDYVHWTKAAEVMRHHPDESHRQTYAMPVFPYGGVYLGILMLLDTTTDTVDCELAWSPDTVEWERISPGTPLIPRGPVGSFDWGCVYGAAYPIEHDGELLLYYGGSDGQHTGWRKGALGLARLRPDGFAGLRSVDGTTGEVVTCPVSCSGESLVVTTDAAQGSLGVEVLEADGGEMVDGLNVSEDVTDHRVVWRSGSDLAAFRGRDIRLKFKLRDCTLYSFAFDG
jgi:hypothetical protein